MIWAFRDSCHKIKMEVYRIPMVQILCHFFQSLILYQNNWLSLSRRTWRDLPLQLSWTGWSYWLRLYYLSHHLFINVGMFVLKRWSKTKLCRFPSWRKRSCINMTNWCPSSWNISNACQRYLHLQNNNGCNSKSDIFHSSIHNNSMTYFGALIYTSAPGPLLSCLVCGGLESLIHWA